MLSDTYYTILNVWLFMNEKFATDTLLIQFIDNKTKLSLGDNRINVHQQLSTHQHIFYFTEHYH